MSASSLQLLLQHPTLNLKVASALLPPDLSAAPAEGELLPWLGHTGTHEWFFTQNPQQSAKNVWYAPLTLLAALSSSIAHLPAFSGKKTLWIGRSCWPAFGLLAAESEKWKKENIFLDPLSDQERFWAMDQALRCPGVGVVVADGSGMDPIASRRLQLAAETAGVLALLVRPPWELKEPSWAQTRWHVCPKPSSAMDLRWDIVLLRCKGSQVGSARRWTAAWSYEVFGGTGALHLSAGVGRAVAATRGLRTA